MHISVIAMTTDSAVTALSFATTFSYVHIAVTLTNMNIACHSAVSCHCCYSAVRATAVTPLSVVTDVTIVCTVMLQCCHCHRCCTVVSLHR